MHTILRSCRYGLLLLAIMAAGTISHAQVTITPNQTATALAQKLAGQGVTVTNAVLTCANQQNGMFTVTSSNLGLDSGIILTTGQAKTNNNYDGANGPAATTYASRDWSNPGDAALTTLAGQATHDACKLEFDFVPIGDTIKFDYVFGSEEYPGYSCSDFNDVFGFFISGPGISGTQNLALIPGTNIPVAINSTTDPNINLVFDTTPCTDMGTGSPFSQYYVDNSAGTTISYDGFTTVLEAISPVVPCSTYHLKLAIADAFDGILDSGVFLKAGSLVSTGFFVSAAQGLAAYATPTIIKGCSPGLLQFHRQGVLTTPQVLTYQIQGTAVSGTDYTPLPGTVTIPAGDSVATVPLQALYTGTNTGPLTVTLLLQSPYACANNMIVDSTTVTLLDPPHINIINPTADTAICLGQSLTLTAQGSIYGMDYQWSPAGTPAGGTDSTSTITDAPVATTNYIVTGTLAGTGCTPVSDTLQVTVNPIPVVNASNSSPTCISSTIDLMADAGGIPNAQYSWTGPNGYYSAEQNPQIAPAAATDAGVYSVIAAVGSCVSLPDTTTVTILSTVSVSRADTICANGSLLFGNQTITAGGTYTHTFSSGNGCDSLVTLTVFQWPAINTNITDSICQGAVYHFGQNDYTDAGTYTRILTAANGCDSNIHLTLKVIPLPVAGIVLPETGCQDEAVTVNSAQDVAGITYTWSFDDGTISSGTGAGPYNVTWATAGVKQITLTANDRGCITVGNDSITIDAIPLAHIMLPQDNICAFDTISLFAAPNPDLLVSYLWQVSDVNAIAIGGDPMLPQVQAVVGSAATVTLTVSGPTGCKASDNMQLNPAQCCQVNMPTAFTPNGDGRNDVFRPVTAHYYRLMELRIVNRWGQTVFYTTDGYGDGWDGTYKGEPQPMDTYYYYMTYYCADGNSATEKHGDVILVR